MKTIMVIPGTAAQIPLIKRLKALNYTVVCVNPYPNSPAFKFSDYYEQYDILNIVDCLSVAKKYNISAIISDQCDIAIPTVAAISEQLQLPSIGCHFAKLYTDKYEMREFCSKHGLAHPKYKKCYSLEDAILFFNELPTKKMIIKPLDSNSSHGVYTITSITELMEHFELSLKFSRSEKVVLCESYIEGTEFTVDGIVINGKHHSLAISKKRHYPHHPNIACELYFSNQDEDYNYSLLRETNDKYVELTKLPFGFTHAEYKYDGSKFVLIEVGARGGGNYISSHIVPVMSGIDNYQILINQILNKASVTAPINISTFYSGRYCVLKFFDIDPSCNGKIVKEIQGLDILKNNKNVILFDFNFKIGDKIYTAESDSSRVGFYIAYGDTKEQLDHLIQTISNNINFEF